MRRQQAGITLIEVLVSITLLSLLSVAMMMALRIGLNSFAKVDSKLMENRRVAGAQRLIEQEIEGLMPVVAGCGQGPRAAFFQGEPQTIRLVSTFSLQQGWRGQPQLLELFVIPGDEGRGVRLVVNEIPYTGALGLSQLCLGTAQDPQTGAFMPRFAPPNPGPRSFVLADKLASCHFVYLWRALQPNQPDFWRENWAAPGWPLAVRIEMAPLDYDPGRLQPITTVVPIHLLRIWDMPYVD